MRESALLLLAVIGVACASGPAPDPTYEAPDPADTSGPAADFSGAWASNDAKFGAFYLSLRQQGSSVTGDMLRRDFSKENPQPPFAGDVTGAVKGRVLEVTWAIAAGQKPPPGQPAQRKITLTQSPDGTRGAMIGWGTVEMHRIYAPPDPPTGLLNARLPFRTDGSVDMKEPPGEQVRDGFAGLVYLATADAAKTEPRAFVVPRDAPRRISRVRFGRSAAEPVSYLFDLPYFKLARARSPLHAKREAIVEGARVWWIFNWTWDEEVKSVMPAVLLVELYLVDPDTAALPVDVTEVGRRTESGDWQLSKGYVWDGQKIIRVQAAMDKGQPTGVQAQVIYTPPLEDVLVSKEVTPWQGRWRNRLLALAKDRTVPKTLRDGTTQELKALADRLDQLTAETGRERESVGERANRAQSEGSEDVEPLRDLEQIYAQRIELFKQIVPAIRAEIDRRGKR